VISIKSLGSPFHSWRTNFTFKCVTLMVEVMEVSLNLGVET